jgi:hypothetical protein
MPDVLAAPMADFCDDRLTLIHMDAHTFALVLIAILLEPLFYIKILVMPCVSTT